jgi:hypothetical protein
MGMAVYETWQESFEDTKGVIRSRKSKDRQCNGQEKDDKKTPFNFSLPSTIIYKILHRKITLITNSVIIHDCRNDGIVITTNCRRDDFYLTTRNPWFNSFFVRAKPLSRKS